MVCLHAYGFMQLLSVLVTQRFVCCVFKLGLEDLQVQGSALRDLGKAVFVAATSTGKDSRIIPSP